MLERTSTWLPARCCLPTRLHARYQPWTIMQQMGQLRWLPDCMRPAPARWHSKNVNSDVLQYSQVLSCADVIIAITEALEQTTFQTATRLQNDMAAARVQGRARSLGFWSCDCRRRSAASHMSQPEVVPTRSTHSSRESARAGS